MTRKEAERQTRQADTLRALGFTQDEAEALRRISMTLQHWFELECGNSNDYASWAIERDAPWAVERAAWRTADRWWTGETWGKLADRRTYSDDEKLTAVVPADAAWRSTGEKPYMVRHIYAHGHGKDQTIRTKIADRETGARKRLAAIIGQRNGRPAIVGGRLNACPFGPVKFYIQTDPRGAALYIIRPGDVPEGKDADGYYTRGICVW